VNSILTTRGALALQSRLARAAAGSLTYDMVGATLDAVTPSGFHAVNRERVVGSGPADFVKARDGLRQWRVHRGAGLLLLPDDASVRVDENVIVLVPIGPLAVASPCRVIAVIDEPRRFACAYGTLSGHPESGEELFDVALGDDDAVTFTIRAFSKPASFLTRVGAPAARMVQAKVTTRYLDALENFVQTA
jgi:uncharacterized protein (UPF0548 family)